MAAGMSVVAERGSVPKSNIQPVSAENRENLRNLSTSVTFDQWHRSALVEMYRGFLWQFATSERKSGALARLHPGTINVVANRFAAEHLIPSKAVTQTPWHSPNLVVTVPSATGFSGSAVMALGGALVGLHWPSRASQERSAYFLHRGFGAYCAYDDLFPVWDQPEITAPPTLPDSLDLAEVAARVVAATRELPVPEIYSTTDNGLVLDFIWEKSRLSCVLRHAYAHVMFFGKDAIAEEILEGETFSEGGLASVIKEFAKQVERDE